MPGNIRPDDWDRLFAPNAPRRGGPMRALGNILFVALVIGIIGGTAAFAVSYRRQQAARLAATATAIAPTRFALRTATAQAQATATIQARLTATALAARATAEATLGVGIVMNGGNLRTEPRIVAETVIGQLVAGDQVTLLEERIVGGETWFRVRLTSPTSNRSAGAATVGAEGWASATLLSQPTPVATP